MKFFLPILLLISLSANAQKSISAQTFQTNVRPVLSGILSDFYQMIMLFPDFPKELVGIVDEIDELHGERSLVSERWVSQHENLLSFQSVRIEFQPVLL